MSCRQVELVESEMGIGKVAKFTKFHVENAPEIDLPKSANFTSV